MKNGKRIISLISASVIAAVLFCSCANKATQTTETTPLPTLSSTVTSAAAETTEETKDRAPQIKIDSVTTHGEEVTLNVLIENNPGIIGGMLTLSFSDELVLENISVGDVLKDSTFTKPGVLESGYSVVWYYADPADADLSDGVLFSMTFSIPGSTAAGQYWVCLLAGENALAGADLSPLEIEIVQGCITVEK